MATTHQVMIVEDDEEIRESLVDFLEEHGYQTIPAVHGRDALNKLTASNQRPCLIVLDLMMPVMDGSTFRGQQLQDPNLSSIPVLVISAYKDVDDRAKALSTMHLKKPLDLRELLRKVQECCPPS